MTKQVKILMLVICTVLLVLLNLNYNPLNYTFINNAVLMFLSMCWLKSYEFIDTK